MTTLIEGLRQVEFDDVLGAVCAVGTVMVYGGLYVAAAGMSVLTLAGAVAAARELWYRY